MATSPALKLKPAIKPATNGSPVAAGLLKERAYTELRAKILRNDFSPGTFLAERQLAAQLGMSKTPVKAALERLAQEGLINVSPQQGIVVRDLTFEEIADLYQIRHALEGFVLRSVAGGLTQAQVRQLEDNLEHQAANETESDCLKAAELDARFHLLFSEFLANQEIVRVMGQLIDKMHRVITRVFRAHPSRAQSSLAEHRELARAVIEGDKDKAGTLIEKHLERGRRLILDPRR
ncbi:MAG TPA: GntR family transcriptional regulator [Caulifigura sp.]|jgi:DNA-binding GntR family transcriptional regulator|nr:GntR family transcriptional regulator [Caulifigura sp.]